LVKELHIAQNALANSGHRSDLTSCQNGTRFLTFEDYLSEVGIKRRTAYNWLFLYDPQEDRLLEPEEARARRDQMLEEMFREIEKHSRKNPDWRPEGWNSQLERAYRKPAVPGTDSKSSTGIARWRFESRVLRNRVPGTLSNKTTRLIRNGRPLVVLSLKVKLLLGSLFRWERPGIIRGEYPINPQG